MDRGASITLGVTVLHVDPFNGSAARKVSGVLITCGTVKLWAPSITDAALLLNGNRGWYLFHSRRAG
jgi:hypothetical protein